MQEPIGDAAAPAPEVSLPRNGFLEGRIPKKVGRRFEGWQFSPLSPLSCILAEAFQALQGPSRADARRAARTNIQG